MIKIFLGIIFSYIVTCIGTGIFLLFASEKMIDIVQFIVGLLMFLCFAIVVGQTTISRIVLSCLHIAYYVILYPLPISIWRKRRKKEEKKMQK